MMSLGSVPCPGPGEGESNLIKHGTLTLLHSGKIAIKINFYSKYAFQPHKLLTKKLLPSFKIDFDNSKSFIRCGKVGFPDISPQWKKCLWLIPDSNLCEHNKSGAGSAYLLRAGGTI